jgi:hypothetical protein
MQRPPLLRKQRIILSLKFHQVARPKPPKKLLKFLTSSQSQLAVMTSLKPPSRVAQ